MTFGPWVFKAFHILAKMKKLRGTKWDIFGYTAERKMERQLIQQFKMTIEKMLSNLNSNNLDLATEISEKFQHIRGFGHVKLKNHQEVMESVNKLLTDYHNTKNI